MYRLIYQCNRMLKYNIHRSVDLCLSARSVFCDVRTEFLNATQKNFTLLRVNCKDRDRVACGELTGFRGCAGCAYIKILFLQEEIIITINVSSETRTG
jgi:hypothetical protein